MTTPPTTTPTCTASCATPSPTCIPRAALIRSAPARAAVPASRWVPLDRRRRGGDGARDRGGLPGSRVNSPTDPQAAAPNTTPKASPTQQPRGRSRQDAWP